MVNSCACNDSSRAPFTLLAKRTRSFAARARISLCVCVCRGFGERLVSQAQRTMRMLGWLPVAILLTSTPAPAASFAEDALSRWPHLERHWLQLQNKRVTTPVPAAAVSGESHEVRSLSVECAH